MSWHNGFVDAESLQDSRLIWHRPYIEQKVSQMTAPNNLYTSIMRTNERITVSIAVTIMIIMIVLLPPRPKHDETVYEDYKHEHQVLDVVEKCIIHSNISFPNIASNIVLTTGVVNGTNTCHKKVTIVEIS
jgi:hypothetical protein